MMSNENLLTVPQIFYFREMDFDQFGYSYEITHHDVRYFFQMCMLTDNLVLPTSNVNLFLFGLKYMDVFYEEARRGDKRICELDSPIVSFLGNDIGYTQTLKKRQTALRKSGGIAELNAYAGIDNFKKGLIIAHEMTLGECRKKPIVKKKQAAEILRKNIHDRILKRSMTTSKDVKKIIETMISDPTRPLSAPLFHEELKDAPGISYPQVLEITKTIHGLFHASNEASIQTSTYRLNNFRRRSIDKIFDFIGVTDQVYQRIIGKGKNIVGDPDLLLKIRNSEHFISMTSTLMRQIDTKLLKYRDGNPQKAVEEILAQYGGFSRLIKRFTILQNMPLAARLGISALLTSIVYNDYLSNTFQFFDDMRNVGILSFIWGSLLKKELQAIGKSTSFLQSRTAFQEELAELLAKPQEHYWGEKYKHTKTYKFYQDIQTSVL